MNTYKTKTPREGLTQHTYSNGYTLSIGMSTTHYSNGKTTAEIAVLDPTGDFVSLREQDDVLAYQPLTVIDEFMEILAKCENPVTLLVEHGKD
tara:strand:+ start:442 stop:720 length:279 start_codon:yes stop_codon:yes gene_type:complete